MQFKAQNTLAIAISAEIKELTQTDVQVKDSIDYPWRVLLFDDDIHSFDEVIEQIMKATGCNYNKAQELTLQVHNEGKAVVYEGDFVECLKIDSVLKEIQLVTEIRG
tara:strand:+ start:22443 stop:22763 length:321 start_codon:yes stop_codon:yes gene_type:complete